MKKLSMYVVAGIMLFSLLPRPVNAVNTIDPVSIPSKVPAESAQSKVFETRLAEIKAMDKSKLNSVEKKELRKELRSMKKAINGGGVYLSVGAIVIIILLLLLLL